MPHLPESEHIALEGRLERLKREERDLDQRVATRITQVEAEDGWLKSDPIYQRLSSVLESVRGDLRDTDAKIRRHIRPSNAHAIA